MPRREPALPEAPRIPWLEAGQPDIVAPDIPWLEAGVPPVDWGCPNGWRAVTADGVTTCEPYPTGGPRACPAGEAHFPGEPGCRPIGAPCGPGPFPATRDLPRETTLLHVRGDAPSGGDGSAEAPLPTLAGALDRSAPGTVILLAAGTYPVDRTWPDGVGLRGRCPRDSVLVAPEDSDRSAVIDVARHEDPVRIENVRIGPAPFVGVRVRRSGAPVLLHGLEVVDVTGDPAGVVVTSGAVVEARDLVVRASRDPSAGDFGGAGLSVEARARLVLQDAVLERNRDAGLLVRGEEAEADVSDLRVEGTRGRARAGTRGVGIWVELGRLGLSRAIVDENRDAGLLALGPGTEVVASDLVVRGTLPQASDGDLGRGLSAEGGAHIELSQALVEGNREVGVLASQGGSATLRDVVVRDTEPRQLGGVRGWGVGAGGGGSVTLERVLLARNREGGLVVVSTGSSVVATDLAVHDTLPREAAGREGTSVSVELGGELTLSRALLVDHRARGLLLLGEGTEVEAEDVVVRGGMAGPNDAVIGGVVAIGGPDLGLSLRRGVIEGTQGAGLVVSDGAGATVEDLLVRDTGRNPSPDLSGGIRVEAGGRLDVQRALLEGNAANGLFVQSEGSEVDGHGLVVRDTRPDLALAGGQGFGVAVRTGGRLEISESLVEGNRHLGVSVFGDSRAVLEDLVVRDTLPQAGESPTAGPGEFGRGVSVERGAEVVLTRVLLARNREVGLFVGLEATRVEATDLQVVGTRPQELDGLFGQGVQIQGGPMARLERVLVEGCRYAGVQILQAEARITDLTVRDTESQASDDAWGRGVNLAAGADLTLRRARLEGNREIGLAAFDPGTRAEIEALTVVGTRAPACAPACAASSDAVNLGVYRGADVDVVDFTLEGGETCGVQLTDDVELDLRDGVVAGHPLGICCERDYPLTRLRQGVAFRANDTQVECSSRPVPDPTQLLPEP